MDAYDEEDLETMSGWHRHGITKKSADMFRKKADGAFHELKTECEQSTDPRVAKAYQRWSQLAEFAAFLRPKGQQ